MNYLVIPSRRIKGFTRTICNSLESALLEKARCEFYSGVKFNIVED